MKPLVIFGLFILTLVLVQSAQAQTADEIIEKHIAAMGGKEKMATLNSVKMEGNMSVQGTDVAITITKLHNTGARTDISVMGTENYQLVTPTKAVSFMPIQGQTEPTPMPEDQAKAGQNQLDLHSIFVDYQNKGTQVELQGKESVEGNECYKLKVTFKNGSVTTYYIDATTYRVDKTSMMLSYNGESVESATNYSNYKQLAEGFWFPFTTTNTRGQIDFDKIQVNITVDENIFK
ncbi:MAG: hypothetical protein JST86_06750 [Bacteroidetes bacterium]|nr:hypothetical protein [Bacteroidota bacterium]